MFVLQSSIQPKKVPLTFAISECGKKKQKSCQSNVKQEVTSTTTKTERGELASKEITEKLHQLVHWTSGCSYHNNTRRSGHR